MSKLPKSTCEVSALMPLYSIGGYPSKLHSKFKLLPTCTKKQYSRNEN